MSAQLQKALAFENVFRGIAMWTVRIEALLTGKTTLRDMLDRLYGKAPIPQGWEVLEEVGLAEKPKKAAAPSNKQHKPSENK
jgi:hypothetical protein